MTRTVVALIVVMSMGCALRRPATVPEIRSLNAYVIGTRLWQDSGGCNRVVAYADGAVDFSKPPQEVCDRAALWLRGRGSVPVAADPAASQ